MNKATSAGGIVVRNNPDKQILLIKFPQLLSWVGGQTIGLKN